MLDPIEDILSRCDGVTVKTIEKQDWLGQPSHYLKLYKTADIKLPAGDIFIEIMSTATKGTIAKISEINVDTYSERYPDVVRHEGSTQIVTYGITLIYEVEGRKQNGRIASQYVKVLTGQQTTKYVRDVQKHKKAEIKNPVNKYKQEMKRGDWVIGVKPGKILGIGRITRWTNSNVWAVTGDDMDDKSKEFKFDCINETFTMPDDEHVKLLTIAVLRGWEGG